VPAARLQSYRWILREVTKKRTSPCVAFFSCLHLGGESTSNSKCAGIIPLFAKIKR